MKKVQKILGFLLILLMMLQLAACTKSEPVPTPSDEASSGEFKWDKVNFRVTSHLSPKHNLYTNFYDKVAKYVTEKTDGAVTFEIFWVGELVELGGESDALLNGIVDMAWPISPTYEATKMPYGEVTLLPLTSSDCTIATDAWQKMLESDVKIADGKTYYELMFGQYGLKVFSPTISETYQIATVGTGFDNISKIKGMQLRTSARPQTMYTSILGCSNVTLPGADVFDALNRKTIDGSVMWVADWPNFGLEELYDYALDGVNLGHFPSVFAMTEKKWNSLQPELQNLLVEAMDKYRLDGAKAIVNDTLNVKKRTSESGVNFVDVNSLSADVREFMLNAMAQTWFDYIDLLESEGKPGKEICKLWRDCVLAAGGSVPEEVMDL
jgi:C4-dicarboxylate-binding protein DctP